jgi:hypothetical protein
MPTEIRLFFDQYREAFNLLDGKAVAQLYAVPSGIVSNSGYTHWPTFEPIRDNMVALCELYRQHGFSSARFEPGVFVPQGEDHAFADVSWQIERVGQEPWCFNTSYNLLRTAQGWRVLLCTAYSEKKLNANAET